MTSATTLYAFVTLLAMVNPVEAAAAFDSLTLGYPAARQREVALRATLVAAVILLGFGVAGNALFSILGISLAAFRIAGGVLLLKVAFDMVFAERTSSTPATGAARGTDVRPDPSVFPLAIPMISGPGALTAIVTLFGKTHGSAAGYVLISLVALFVLALTYAAMRGSQAITQRLGPTGVDAVGRVLGILVAALAIQLVVDGISSVVRGDLST